MSDMMVSICDVGPRDGLQNDAVYVTPSVRADLVDRLAAAGLPIVEAVSFVHPDRVPQMAGAEEVIAGLGAKATSARIAALVLNGRGCERAIAAGVDELHVAYPLTETFVRRNQNMSLGEARDQAVAIIAAGAADGLRVTATLAVAFGCPFEGAVPSGRVAEHAAAMAAAGADEVVLADTVGFAFPGQVRELVRHIAREVPDTPLGLHLHNTRNTGYANAVAGLEEGIRSFDASVGGIGGCPFAPRASGNVATEDLVHLLHAEGAQTGIDLDALLGVTEWLGQQLGRSLPGLVHRAGPTPKFSPDTTEVAQ
jgi:isopropylmalate/homocitrate/citramalate synthase